MEMLSDDDKKWFVERLGSLIRQSIAGVESQVKWHSGEIADVRYHIGVHEARMEKIEVLLEQTVTVVAALSTKIDRLVDAMLARGGNGHMDAA